MTSTVTTSTSFAALDTTSKGSNLPNNNPKDEVENVRPTRDPVFIGSQITSLSQMQSALQEYHLGLQQGKDVKKEGATISTGSVSINSFKSNDAVGTANSTVNEDQPEEFFRRCKGFLSRLQPHDNENQVEEDKETEWKSMMTQILVSTQSLASNAEMPGTKNEGGDQSEVVFFKARQLRLRKIQLQALTRLTLWALHGDDFVKSYVHYYRNSGMNEKQPTKKRKSKADMSPVPQDDPHQAARQFLLDEIHKILSMAAFCLPQHDSFARFLASSLPKSLLHYPTLRQPISYLFDQFEILNPYQLNIANAGRNDVWDKQKKKRRNSLTWMEPLPQSRPKKKTKTGGVASSSKAVPPPPQKKLLSMIGAKSRYRGSHFQSNLPSISRLLDQHPSQASRNIAPPKTQLQIKPLMRRRASTGSNISSAPCLRPIRINPIASTTVSNRTSIPPLSPFGQGKQHSSLSLQPPQHHSRAPRRPDGDATPTRSNRRRAIQSEGQSSSHQTRMVVEETPSKQPPQQSLSCSIGAAVSVAETPIASSQSPVAITSSRRKESEPCRRKFPGTPILPTPAHGSPNEALTIRYASLTPQDAEQTGGTFLGRVSTDCRSTDNELHSPETPPLSGTNATKSKFKKHRHDIVAQQLLFSPPPRRLSTGGIKSRQL